MTDIELTKRCAERMGLAIDDGPNNGGGANNTGIDVMGRLVLDWHNGVFYDPLHDDAQAFALVEKFDILLFKPDGKWQAVHAAEWNKGHPGMYVCDQRMTWGESANLNRAIVSCVAAIP